MPSPVTTIVQTAVVLLGNKQISVGKSTQLPYKSLLLQRRHPFDIFIDSLNFGPWQSLLLLPPVCVAIEFTMEFTVK